MAAPLDESLLPESLAQCVLAEQELWGGLQQLHVPEIINTTSDEFILRVKTLCTPESVLLC